MDAHFAFDRRFILTQCPRQNTVGDFWRMIQERSSPTIVMLNEFEENTELFALYFPTQMNVPHFFGDVQVSLFEQNNIQDANISRRSYSVSSAGMEPRSVTHLHYHNWGDGQGGNPVRISSLIDQINQSQQGGLNPVTIHCGAGMGRTGTFAVILKLAQDFQAGIQNLSIRDSVAYLRDFNTGRGGGMIIEKQYLFCHSALQFRIGDQ
jgi:protein tyrosine phosphatase